MSDEQADSQEDVSTPPWVRYVLPFAIFMIATSLEPSWAKMGFYEVAYTLKLILVGAAIVWGRRVYPSWSSRGWAQAVLLGSAGAVFWVLLADLEANSGIKENLPSWLASGKRAGFDPYHGEGSISLASWAFVVVRLTGLIAIVPVMEEVFWRGFLMPYLIDGQFDKVKPGTYTHFSFVFVTLAFTLVHTEWSSALVWGIGVNVLYYWTKNIWACVIMHMVSNALLGIWIMQTQSWELW